MCDRVNVEEGQIISDCTGMPVRWSGIGSVVSSHCRSGGQVLGAWSLATAGQVVRYWESGL